MKQVTIAALIALSTGIAWSADNTGDAGALNAMRGSLTAHPVVPTGTELYAYMHDPAINAPDRLGNYGENYRATYPDHVTISGAGISKLTLVK